MTKNKTPRISILIPSYNSARFLEDTLDTLLQQSYEDWEAIIMDGGSTDGSKDILTRYAREDPRFRVFLETDEGPYHAIHKALWGARGEWCFVLAISDGYIDRDWFKKCMDVVDRDREVSLVWGIPMDMTEDGVIAGPSYMYAHFLKKEMQKNAGRKRTTVVGKVVGKFNVLKPRDTLNALKKINLLNVKVFLNMLRSREVPQKRAWFAYWLSTGQIFPDSNMCVATKVMRECLPPYHPGSREPGDWMGFYFNFNSRGYLAYCIPTPATYGRIHGGQVSEVWKRYNDQNRIDYYKKLQKFKQQYYRNPAGFVFKDRNGNPLPA